MREFENVVFGNIIHSFDSLDHISPKTQSDAAMWAYWHRARSADVIEANGEKSFTSLEDLAHCVPTDMWMIILLS